MRFWPGSSDEFNTKRSQRRAIDPLDQQVDDCLSLLAQTGRASASRGPDRTADILARVGQHIPLVDQRERRWLSAGRLAAGLILATAVGVGAIAMHQWRDTAAMNGSFGQSAPASTMLASAWSDVNSAVSGVAAASQQASLFRPASLLMGELETPAPARIAHEPLLLSWNLVPAFPPAASPPSTDSAALSVLRHVLPAQGAAPLADRVAAELTGCVPGLSAPLDPMALPR